MSDSEAIDQYQRWLQARLTIAEQIDDPSERLRATLQVESAIHLAIQYRELVELTPDDIAPPFVEVDSPIRILSDEDSVISTTSHDTTICTKCDAEMTQDLEFCPACGEYR
ncbi:MAG: hypothetical protein CMB04_01280 [Euryarchaeota archaeon]|nr:hypothetical protein [Euryarchaeota archaeon]|tara:strand:- start:8087 stop:8419 length:333 start_codon:yes stop_codon:yes gene_type:complete